MRQPDRLLTDFLLNLCSPRINASISSMLQQKTLGSLPCHCLVWNPMNPIDLSPSKHNPRLLAWSQIQTKQETPANPRATSLKPANGLKFNLYLSYPFLGSNKPRSIPSSVSGSLLWSPFPLWPHYQEITKNISSTFFSLNSSQYLRLQDQQPFSVNTLPQPSKKTDNTQASNSPKFHGRNRNKETKAQPTIKI